MYALVPSDFAKTEFAAQNLSLQLSEKIKNGEVRGTRAFSGEFFIIDSSLFDNKSDLMRQSFNDLAPIDKPTERISEKNINIGYGEKETSMHFVSPIRRKIWMRTSV